jgi:hypothetical protein
LRRRISALLAVALSAVMIGGCGSLADLASLSSSIQEAGYEQVQVNHNVNNGRDVVTVEALTPNEPATDEDVREIAEIVWQTYPRRVDELRIVLNGRPAAAVTRDELAQEFGARDPALDRGSGIGQFLLIALLVFLTGVALVVVLVIVLVRRSRRSRRVPDAPYPPGRPGVMYPQVPPQPPGPSPDAPPATPPQQQQAQPPASDQR